MVLGKDDTKRYWNEFCRPHREDGPAVEYSNGDKEWWINGKQHSFNSFLKNRKCKCPDYLK